MGAWVEVAVVVLLGQDGCLGQGERSLFVLFETCFRDLGKTES